MPTGDAPTMPPAEDGVDVSLIRWMQSLSADERLAVLQGFADSVAAVTDESPGSSAGRDNDLAVLAILRRTLEESKR